MPAADEGQPANLSRERWRLFVGVPLPEEMRQAIASAVAPVRAATRARWVRPESLHVTLTFLGDVPANDAPQIGDRASALVSPFGPFRAALGEAGAFGRGRRPRTVWLGLAVGDSELAALATAVNRGLTDEETGKAAHPHVTVARDVPPEVSNALFDALRPLAGTAWRVERAYLYRSHLGAGGSRYEPVAELSLRGRTETF